LVPYEIYDDDEISRGNPDLEPMNSNSFDLMFENYSAQLGFFSAGVFYKKITNAMIRSEYNETIGGEVYEVSQPINGDDDATVFGVEFAVNQRLNILNIPALNHFNIYANYTFTNSNQTVEGRELPLANSPQHIFNLAFMYDNPENGLSFVISNNYRSSILGSVETGEGENNKYYDAYFEGEYHLDISATKKITDKLTLTMQLNNLTDQEEHEVFGDPAESYSIIRQWAKFNRYGTVSLSYRL
jgi:TonB-dependent receptor